MKVKRWANDKRFVNGECKRTVDAKLNDERTESRCWMLVAYKDSKQVIGFHSRGWMS